MVDSTIPEKMGWYRVTLESGSSILMRLCLEDGEVLAVTADGYVATSIDCKPHNFLYDCVWGEYLGETYPEEK